jgi:16S rRNA (guanine527-N7)-methyltransferase
MYDLLIDCLDEFNIEIDTYCISTLLDYWDILNNKNRNINLISRSLNQENGFILHIIDSLTGLLFDWPEEMNYMDLGSGGGLPGLPLAISNPGWSTTLIESKAKKADFLSETVQTLGLANVEVINSYLEPDKLPAQPFCDLVTTRGLALLGDTLPFVGPAIKPGGFYLAYKGPKGWDEFNKSTKMLYKYRLILKDKIKLKLPILNNARLLLLFQKQ